MAENNKALRPLREGMDIVCLYLDDLVDRDAMEIEARGGLLWTEALADAADENGKRKVRDDLTIAVTRDGKRLRRLSGDAVFRSPEYRTVIYAESARLRPYLAPLINLRGFVLSFIAQAGDLIARHCYPVTFRWIDARMSDSDYVPVSGCTDSSEEEVAVAGCMFTQAPVHARKNQLCLAVQPCRLGCSTLIADADLARNPLLIARSVDMNRRVALRHFESMANRDITPWAPMLVLRFPSVFVANVTTNVTQVTF
ncbi:hypothetical protein B0H13DRAFT_2430195 [Mycena leptocephala]|nr:hypothetical protein B0H13DRAFT_2430195 [Mycena leptocephala]